MKISCFSFFRIIYFLDWESVVIVGVCKPEWCLGCIQFFALFMRCGLTPALSLGEGELMSTLSRVRFGLCYIRKIEMHMVSLQIFK